MRTTGLCPLVIVTLSTTAATCQYKYGNFPHFSIRNTCLYVTSGEKILQKKEARERPSGAFPCLAHAEIGWFYGRRLHVMTPVWIGPAMSAERLPASISV